MRMLQATFSYHHHDCYELLYFYLSLKSLIWWRRREKNAKRTFFFSILQEYYKLKEFDFSSRYQIDRKLEQKIIIFADVWTFSLCLQFDFFISPWLLSCIINTINIYLDAQFSNSILTFNCWLVLFWFLLISWIQFIQFHRYLDQTSCSFKSTLFFLIWFDSVFFSCMLTITYMLFQLSIHRAI